MIASVRGIVQQAGEGRVVLEVGGVGLLVSVPIPLAALAAVGHPLALFTHLAVREDALALYGFETPDQRDFFEQLLGVSGIGPKLALALLSHFTVDVLRQAIMRNQPERISGVPGVGKKTAEKIIFHLKEKIGLAPDLGGAGWSETDAEVVAALTTLGYSLVEAQTALQSIPRDAPEDAATRLQMALQGLGK
jgi:holliday junction DNA helicase RuvA